MANYADKATDLKLAQMEKKIARIYKDASNGLQKEANDYFASFASRYDKEYDAYLQGKYTDAQFKSWYYAQVGRGERWQVLKTDMAKRMTQANQIAAAYINDNTPGIYTLNANFAAYEIEGATGIAFNLVNEQAVRRLVEGKNHTEFRTLSVNPKRDYNWNTQKIQDALLSGILQGNSITKLTDKFMEVMGTNKNAAIRNCRTAVTSAQNGGRQSTFKRAQAMGIYLQKEWIATNDSRTRDSHRELDGVRVENDEPFPNGCMYPADPGGEPSEVYNCRCTMRAILPRYNGNKRMTALNGGANTRASYAKWVFEKEKIKSVKEAFTSTEARGKIKEIENLYKNYTRAVDTGYLSPLADFDLYKKTDKEINEKVIGLTTVNGITISSRSYHSIERVIGSVEQRREGVSVDDVVEALTNPGTNISNIKYSKNGASQKFVYGNAEVSINPFTGNFIQTNPKRRSK